MLAFVGNRLTLVTLGGALLLLLVLQWVDSIGSGVKGLIYAVCAVLIVVTVVLPWLFSSWARRLRNSLETQHPDSVATIATTTMGNGSSPRSQVVVADKIGISFHGPHGEKVQVPWSEVLSVDFIQIGVLHTDCFRLALSNEISEIRLIPMRRNGQIELSALAAGEYLSALRGARAAAARN